MPSPLLSSFVIQSISTIAFAITQPIRLTPPIRANKLIGWPVILSPSIPVARPNGTDINTIATFLIEPNWIRRSISIAITATAAAIPILKSTSSINGFFLPEFSIVTLLGNWSIFSEIIFSSSFCTEISLTFWLV